MTVHSQSKEFAHRWSKTWLSLGLSAPAPSLFQELYVCYSEPTRFYHTAQHLAECFSHFDAARGLANNPGEVELALCFHDAIYDNHASDNEARSAQWARTALRASKPPTAVCQCVEALILATRHNAEPEAGDACLTVDIDLAILAAPAARFDEYEMQIRQEYVWVEASAFIEARTKILRRFTAETSIYRTEFFRNRFEHQATTNMQTGLARLDGAPPATARR
jgi:predicted metal-dependent HD superfamily phosphohydrolase